MFQSLHFIISSPYAARKILSLAIVLLYMYREVPLLFPKFHFIIYVHISSVYKDLILKGSYQNSLFRLAFLDPYIRSSSSCPSQSCLCTACQPFVALTEAVPLVEYLWDECGRGSVCLARCWVCCGDPRAQPTSGLTEYLLRR